MNKNFLLSLSRFEYNNVSGINQSFLKQLIFNPSEIGKPSEEKEYYIFGNLVDFLLTNPNADKEFEDRYIVRNYTSLNSNYKVIAEIAYNTLENFTFTDKNQAILNAFSTTKYQPRWTDQTKIDNFQKEIGSYFNDLSEIGSKQVLLQEVYDTARDCVQRIHKSAFARFFLHKPSKNADYEEYNIFGACLVSFINEVQIKGLLDVINVVVKDNTIYMRIVDLKTTSTYFGLDHTFFKLGYDIQAFVYHTLLQHLYLEILNYLKIDIEDKYVEFSEPLYVFVHSSGTLEPIAIKVSNKTLEGTAIGKRNYEHAKRWFRVYDYLDQYKTYYSLQGFDIPYEFGVQNFNTLEI